MRPEAHPAADTASGKKPIHPVGLIGSRRGCPTLGPSQPPFQCPALSPSSLWCRCP